MYLYYVLPQSTLLFQLYNSPMNELSNLNMDDPRTLCVALSRNRFFYYVRKQIGN